MNRRTTAQIIAVWSLVPAFWVLVALLMVLLVL